MNTRRDEIRLKLTRQLQQMIGEIVEDMLKSLDEDITVFEAAREGKEGQ